MIERVTVECTSLLYFGTMSYTLFLHCYAAVGKILADTSRCAVHLWYESFSLCSIYMVFCVVVIRRATTAAIELQFGNC